MFKKLKQRSEGFTIIEVLIVLAIAALILLIVFLAVPALQRNSRNTQRKNDVGAILAGYNDYITNNNGALPVTPVVCTSNPYKFVGGGTCAAPTGGVASEFNMGYYTAGPDIVAGGQSALTTDIARVVTGAKCGANGATVPGSTRQVAIQYMFEPNTTLTATCTDS
ncbi:MAG TPA: prepilin-type N-terminal cleavage/methylation domain-containing protein [Candidatus Saccharimonadales bacterium]|nr:prepilin-type N-terminal cleavage/methylation domain-containing protein [Candidatus Saccharimonadales bacterium]